MCTLVFLYYWYIETFDYLNIVLYIAVIDILDVSFLDEFLLVLQENNEGMDEEGTDDLDVGGEYEDSWRRYALKTLEVLL